MHDDARSGETEFVDGDVGDAGRVSEAEHAGGVSVADSGADFVAVVVDCFDEPMSQNRDMGHPNPLRCIVVE